MSEARSYTDTWEMLSMEPEMSLDLLLAHPEDSEQFSYAVSEISRLAEWKLKHGNVEPGSEQFINLHVYKHLSTALDVALDLVQEDSTERDTDSAELLSEYWQASTAVLLHNTERLSEVDESRVSLFDFHRMFVRQYIDHLGETTEYYVPDPEKELPEDDTEIGNNDEVLHTETDEQTPDETNENQPDEPEAVRSLPKKENAPRRDRHESKAPLVNRLQTGELKKFPNLYTVLKAAGPLFEKHMDATLLFPQLDQELMHNLEIRLRQGGGELRSHSELFDLLSLDSRDYAYLLRFAQKPETSQENLYALTRQMRDDELITPQKVAATMRRINRAWHRLGELSEDVAEERPYISRPDY